MSFLLLRVLRASPLGACVGDPGLDRPDVGVRASSDAEIVTEDSVKIFEGRENIKLNAAVLGKIENETLIRCLFIETFTM